MFILTIYSYLNNLLLDSKCLLSKVSFESIPIFKNGLSNVSKFEMGCARRELDELKECTLSFFDDGIKENFAEFCFVTEADETPNCEECFSTLFKIN